MKKPKNTADTEDIEPDPRLNDITPAVANLFLDFAWLTQKERNTLLWMLTSIPGSPFDEFAIVPRVEATHAAVAFGMIKSYITTIDGMEKRRSRAATTKKKNTARRNRIIAELIGQGVLKTPEEFFEHISDHFSDLLHCGKKRISTKSMMDSYNRSRHSQR
jgi:hypothetical protein